MAGLSSREHLATSALTTGRSRKPSSFDLVSVRNVVHPRDPAHAAAVLEELGCTAEGPELDRLARRVASGAVVLVRRDDDVTFDGIDDFAHTAPLLSSMAANS